MKKYLLILIGYAVFGQASNQMVTFTQASTSGFTLNSGQSHVTSTECMTKSQAFTKYNLATTANTNTVASNQLLRRDYWITGVTYYTWQFDGYGSTGASGNACTDPLSDMFLLYTSTPTIVIGTIIYNGNTLSSPSDGGGFEYYNHNTNEAITWTSSGVVTSIISCSADTTPPSAPTSLTSTLYSPTEIRLDWVESTDNVAIYEYEIERSTTSSSSGFTIIGTSFVNAYYDATVSPLTTYYYRVRAYDDAGNMSGYSNVKNQYTFN